MGTLRTNATGDVQVFMAVDVILYRASVKKQIPIIDHEN
jgi:hypothetical protein